MKVKRILFPTDFSPCADAALTHALFHAEIFDAELHIVHGVVHISEEVPYFNVDPDLIDAKMEEVAKARMAESLQLHQDSPFRILEENVRGRSAPNIILEYAADRNCDMIVMGTHGRRFLEHFLLGSVAETVTRMAPCPVVTVRAGKTPVRLQPIRHIMTPIDFSNTSERSLEIALAMGAIHGAEKLTLLHVVEDYFYPAGIEPGIAAISDLIPKLLDERRNRLQHLAGKLTGNLPRVACEVIPGRPAHTIVKYADQNNVDLIIAGTGGAGGLGKMLLGSAVERILRLANCPVLTFR